MKSNGLPSSLFAGLLVLVAALLLRPTAENPGSWPESTLGAAGSSSTPSFVVGTARVVGVDPSAAPEEPLPAECAIWYGTTDRIALTLDQWASASTAVVLARVQDMGDTQWNTPDGRPPEGREAEASDFMRLIHLAPIDTLKGELTSEVAWIPGGTIGCLTFILDEYDVKVGQDYLVFMRELGPSTGLKGTLNARLMWPVEADGTVATPVEGTLTVVEIGERIAGTSE